MTSLALAVTAAGTVEQIRSTRQAGEDAQKLAEARAAIDIQTAEAARETSVEKAKIRTERGRRLIATQKALAAAGNIRINVGVPLVIEAETRDIIAQDVGFILQTGREEAGFFRSRAALEIATGKRTKKRLRSRAISQGLLGFGSIAFMGQEAGVFG